MADVASVVSADEAKVTKAVDTALADVKVEAVKVETVVKSTWVTKVKPWLTHLVATIAGYAVARFL